MRHIAFIITALAASSAFASDSVPAHIAKERDLDAYESGGVYRTPINVDQLTDIEHLRQFVWSHWKRKRRGYVEFDFLGTDAATENWLFIEPAIDRWRISWVEQGYRAPGLSPLPQVHRDIVTVERGEESEESGSDLHFTHSFKLGSGNVKSEDATPLRRQSLQPTASRRTTQFSDD